MEFGIFDWQELTGRPLGEQYRARLELVQAAERLGFFCYHLSEHHGSELSSTPSPGIFLAAAAAATSRIHLGPLVYTLPYYHPLRLAEEICMLDQLSAGRLEVGIGRGVSPAELALYGLTPESARARFDESLEIILATFDRDRLTHHGAAYDFDDVPVLLRPHQLPHPPIWYPSSGKANLPWAAAQGWNTVFLGPLDSVADSVDLYRANLPPGAVAKIGVMRLVVVAERDEEAWSRALPAVAAHRAHHGVRSSVATGAGSVDPEELRRLVATGIVAVGSPERVAEQVAAMIEATGVDYFVLAPVFGDLDGAWGTRCIELFAERVVPALTG